ncbi:hypothetical protein ACI784_11975 [Geodermatophilus sp. SYSU D01186]
MSEATFEVVSETVESLEEIAVAEGATTTTTTSSVDVPHAPYE